VPVFIDIYDLWLDILKAAGMNINPCLLFFISKICRPNYLSDSRIVALLAWFTRSLVDRGVPGSMLASSMFDQVRKMCGIRPPIYHL
jgi:hypothetical protein